MFLLCNHIGNCENRLLSRWNGRETMAGLQKKGERKVKQRFLKVLKQKGERLGHGERKLEIKWIARGRNSMEIIKLLSSCSSIFSQQATIPNCQHSSNVSFTFQAYGREIPICIYFLRLIDMLSLVNRFSDALHWIFSAFPAGRLDSLY